MIHFLDQVFKMTGFKYNVFLEIYKKDNTRLSAILDDMVFANPVDEGELVQVRMPETDEMVALGTIDVVVHTATHGDEAPLSSINVSRREVPSREFKLLEKYAHELEAERVEKQQEQNSG